MSAEGPKHESSKKSNRASKVVQHELSNSWLLQVTDGDAFLTTTVTATNIVEPDSARASFDHWTSTRFSYECQCGAQATEANAKWCRHAVATVLEMVDPFTEKERPDYAYYKVRRGT